MHFEIIGDITEIEPIAVGSAIREVARLRKQYGRGRWRKLKGVALIRLANGRLRRAELHGYEAYGLGSEKSNGSGTWINMRKHPENMPPRFAVCINNTNYPASLELHKIYQVLLDEEAARDGDIRVIDESGEDYLYPASSFVVIEVPQEVERAILHAS
jgi:hypothetical protein